jgi:hypothetical protein
MYTKASFIGQMSDSISRLILPKNFYDLRHAIPQIAVSKTSQDFLRSINPPPTHPQKKFPVYKFPLFKKYFTLHRSLFFLAAGHLCFCM